MQSVASWSSAAKRLIAAAVMVGFGLSACSGQAAEPAPTLPAPAVTRAERLLSSAPRPSHTGEDVFDSVADATVVHGFVRESSRLVASDAVPSKTTCETIASGLGLAAPPDDLFAAAGRVRDDTLAMLLLHARREVGELVSGCTGGSTINAASIESARVSVALVQSRLATLGVTP